jgi:hypothetical protein
MRAASCLVAHAESAGAVASPWLNEQPDLGFKMHQSRDTCRYQAAADDTGW